MTPLIPMYLVLVVTVIDGPDEVIPITTHKLNYCEQHAQRENLKRGWMKMGYRPLRTPSPRIIRFKVECRENI